jgi:peroxiredoxin Q/BCP
LDAKNAVVLGVSFDTVDENRAFAEKFSFPYLLLSDTSRDLGMKYGAAEGAGDGYARRVGYVIGPDGRVVRVWPKASPQSFADEALATL